MPNSRHPQRSDSGRTPRRENYLGVSVRRRHLPIAAHDRYITETTLFEHQQELVLMIPAQGMSSQLGVAETPAVPHLEPQPDLLHLREAIAARALVDQDGGAVTRACGRAPQPPLALQSEVRPRNIQRHQELAARLQ